MKKLNKDKKSSSKVTPSILSNIDDYLAMLIPSTILTLIASLSEEDKQVLAYLISCSNNNPGNLNTKSINNSKARARDHQDGSHVGGKRSGHSPAFECDCFGCYMSFWARWDASENRQLIHEIIEAYEEDSAKETRVKSGGTMRRSKRRNTNYRVCSEDQVLVKEEKVVVDEELVGLQKEDGFGFEEESGEVGIEKGSFRRLLSFVGEKVSGFWNMG